MTCVLLALQAHTLQQILQCRLTRVYSVQPAHTLLICTHLLLFHALLVEQGHFRLCKELTWLQPASRVKRALPIQYGHSSVVRGVRLTLHYVLAMQATRSIQVCVCYVQVERTKAL